MADFGIAVVWDEKRGCYVATASCFPGVEIEGTSPQDVTIELEMAIEEFLRMGGRPPDDSASVPVRR